MHTFRRTYRCSFMKQNQTCNDLLLEQVFPPGQNYVGHHVL